nr:MAG TPA: hypothetical protein [Caudoviricetes sp.]
MWASEFTSLNYPFDFAFFAHVTPVRCPTEKVPEILLPLPLLFFRVCLYFLCKIGYNK